MHVDKVTLQNTLHHLFCKNQEQSQIIQRAMFMWFFIYFSDMICTLLNSVLKACSRYQILRIRYLVLKIGSRRSDGPNLRFRFCGENVGRSFVVCSQDPIFRTNKESSIWHQNDHRDIMQNLSASFIFQEECWMKMEHVLFTSIFQITDPCIGRSFSMCSHDPIFGNQQKSDL